jgi:hypothetical protein
MASNQVQPFFGGLFFGQAIGKVIPGFPAALTALLEGAFTAHHHHRSGIGKIQR